MGRVPKQIFSTSGPPLRDLPQQAHATGQSPLDDEDVAGFVEARIVRVQELAVRPIGGLTSQSEFAVVEDSVGPGLLVAQMRDDLVVFVEQAQVAATRAS